MMSRDLITRIYTGLAGFASKRIRKLFLRLPGFHALASAFRWRSFMRPGDTVVQAGVDMGAKLNRGQIPNALSMAQVVGTHGRVIAIEPSKENAALLRTYLKMHEMHNIIVVEKALWSSRATLLFKLGKQSWHNRLAQVSSSQDQSTSFNGSYEVQGDKLDSILKELGIENVAHVCLTINGAELEALKGMPGILKQEHIGLLVASGETQAFNEVIGSVPTNKRIAELLISQGFSVTIDRIGWVTARR
ncbi:MAG: FkbM family methyltransferase [Anaerolineales bacterium]